MQRYFSNKLDNNYFTLSNDDMYHILTVMRMSNGSKVEVVYNNKVYLGELEDKQVKCTGEIEELAESLQEIILCIPLLKEQKMDYILQKATELGVNEIIPLNLERSIVKLDKKKEESRIIRWTKICKEASEQSKRQSIPNIRKVMEIKDLKDMDGFKILCSTREKNKTIKKWLQSNYKYDKIIIVVGPEGGISEREENLFNEMGFESVSLGRNILRVETAPLYVLSVLSYVNME